MRALRHCTLLLALILILTSVLPIGTASAEMTGVVKGGWLILRASPSFNGKILASYPSGTIVTINGQEGSWYAVTTPDGMNGYMLGDYLQISGGGGLIPVGTIAYVTSRNGLNVRLRSGPGKGYSILASYAPGTECQILSAGQNWCRVQIGSFIGYMMTQFLTSSYVSPTIAPQPTPGQEYKVYVTSSNGKGVNLRSGPGKSYNSIGFFSVGTAAWMISKGSTWSYIRVGDRYGYMMTKYLTEKQPVPPSPQNNNAHIVSANGQNVNLRTGPSIYSEVIASFPVGTRLTVVTRGEEWYFVQIDGYYGYMMRQFIYDLGAAIL